jgi:hypothetical protein
MECVALDVERLRCRASARPGNLLLRQIQGTPSVLLSSSLPSRGMGIRSIDEFAVRLMKPSKQGVMTGNRGIVTRGQL